jgi:hypothetical protein
MELELVDEIMSLEDESEPLGDSVGIPVDKVLSLRLL